MKFLITIFVVTLVLCCQYKISSDTSQSIDYALKAIIDKHNKSTNECIYSDTLFLCNFIKKPSAFISKAGRSVIIQPRLGRSNRLYSVISYYNFKNDTAKITLFKESCGVVSNVKLLK